MVQVKMFLLFLFFIVKFTDGRRLKFDDVEQLIQDAGFKSEHHLVETEDGYILKVHRIRTKLTSNEPRLGPVFFMHGLTATAADYLMTGPEIGIPYLLSNKGYDVWLGNARGTDHSLKHKTLDPKTKEFWDFSWHEIGYYDVPAMIDYMLSITNSSKTFYVGHSQGCTTALVFLTTRPEYNQKIIQLHLMAPAAFMKNLPHPMANLVMSEVESYGNRESHYDFSGNTTTVKSAILFNKALCESSLSAGLCGATLAMICGQNKYEVELDMRILPTYLQHVSHSGSVKQFVHFIQLHKSGFFRQFDHLSLRGNRQRYNLTSPPEYDLNNVKVPTYIYSGSCDMIVSERDIEHLKEVLPNVRKYKSFKNFNHCDFTYGKNTRTLLFVEILKDMDSEKGP